MSRLALYLPVACCAVMSAGAAAAACLPTETPVNGACASRIINHFAIGSLEMTGVPTAGDRVPPPPPAVYDVGTLAMTGLGGPPLYDVGTITMTGTAIRRRP